MFEAEGLAALRIDTGHHVLDGPIFSGDVPLDVEKREAGVTD
jgi:hypothetical protein